MRKSVVSVGYGSASYLGSRGAWHFTWLPKGYGPSEDQIEMCLLVDFDGSSEKYSLGKENRHPLVAAIAKAIEDYMANPPFAADGRQSENAKKV